MCGVIRMILDVENEMKRIINIVKNDQSANGSWVYPFETGIKTDAWMIILLRSLEINDEALIQSLVRRIVSKQEENGAWKLFDDEKNGNLTATVDAYYALLYSGYHQKNDKEMLAAKRQILALGGIENVHLFTKIMLALTGQYKWPRYFPLPPEIILFPLSFPINYFDISVFGRANLTPILIVGNKRFSLKTTRSPNLQDLFQSRENEHQDDNFWNESAEWRSLSTYMQQAIKSMLNFPANIRATAIKQAEKYMIDRLEPDGTFSNYFSSTFLMIFALLSLDYSKSHPVIQKALTGLKSMTTLINGQVHMQYTTATVWNTNLLSYALQEAGVSFEDTTIQKANHYLLSRQHYRYGDWAIHNPNSLPGGWGFSDLNTMHPDIDDTTASLRAIHRAVKHNTSYRHAWDRGINWLLTMQNNDGGWPAFEKNVNKKLLTYLPIEGGEYIFLDPSTADLTGRTLEFFGNFTNLTSNHSSIKNGVKWLKQNQEKDGSWYGRWGICYIYGTWAAVTGMISVGVSPNDPSIIQALNWLKSIQNSDGGWGESCNSDIYRTYIPLNASTITQTAWAVDTLISASEKTTSEIDAGIQFLLTASKKEDWTKHYPKGQGLAGEFYMHYHSYDYIFSLLALSHYHKKYK